MKCIGLQAFFGILRFLQLHGYRDVRKLSFLCVRLYLPNPLALHLFFASVHDFSMVYDILKVTEVQFVSSFEGLVIMVHQRHDKFCVVLHLRFQ